MKRLLALVIMVLALCVGAGVSSVDALAGLSDGGLSNTADGWTWDE